MKWATNLCRLLLILFLTNQSNAQGFPRTISQSGYDFNHYSIETTSKGEYVCAGTLFEAGGNNDIHIIQLDAAGNTMWEKRVDKSKDDRALDLVVDPMGNIVVTGYISPRGNTESDLYVLKLDHKGQMIAANAFQIENANAGTNIIYSKQSSSYIIGGLTAFALSRPLTNNTALVLEVDPLLNYVNHNQFLINLPNFNSINDIVETPLGFFVTGGVGVLPNNQVVLALQLDKNLNVQHDLSFNSSNALQVGVSALYDEHKDRVYILSNNSADHSPNVTSIDDISGSPLVTGHFVLGSPFLYNAAGFDARFSTSNPDHLVICGYYQYHQNNSTNTATYNHASPWIIEFDPLQGQAISGNYWTAPSPFFSQHGGGVFSSFGFSSASMNAPFPIYFNQEILTESSNGSAYIFLGPRDDSNQYALDIVSLNIGDPPGCFENQEFNVLTGQVVPFKVVQVKQPNLRIDPKTKLLPIQTSNHSPECMTEPCPVDCEVSVIHQCGISYDLVFSDCLPSLPGTIYEWNINDLNVSSWPGQSITVNSLGGSFNYSVKVTFTNAFGYQQECLFNGVLSIPYFDCSQVNTNASISHLCGDDYVLDVYVYPDCLPVQINNVNLSKIVTIGNPACSPITNGSGQTIQFDIGNCGYGTYQLTGLLEIQDQSGNSISCNFPYGQQVFIYDLIDPCTDEPIVYGVGYNLPPPAYLGCQPNESSYLEYTVFEPTGPCYEYYWNGSTTPGSSTYHCCPSDSNCGAPSVLIKNTCNCCEYYIPNVNAQFSKGNTGTDYALNSDNKQSDLERLPTDSSGIAPFSTWPNPVNTTLHIQFGNSSERIIRILDATGKTMYERNSMDKIVEVDVITFPPGVYMLQVIDAQTERMHNKQIVVSQ